MPDAVFCDYCHLPMPPVRRVTAQRTSGPMGPTETPAEPLYCCYGCSFAARIIHARGHEGEATWMLTRLGVISTDALVVLGVGAALSTRTYPR